MKIWPKQKCHTWNIFRTPISSSNGCFFSNNCFLFNHSLSIVINRTHSHVDHTTFSFFAVFFLSLHIKYFLITYLVIIVFVSPKRWLNVADTYDVYEKNIFFSLLQAIDTVMSTDSSLQPLSIKSIATKYTLPVVIRPALGFRGSNQSILLHSITSITFAFGRALRKQQQRAKKTDYQSFRATDSERVAIPLKYPGKSSLLSYPWEFLFLFRIFRMFAAIKSW